MRLVPAIVRRHPRIATTVVALGVGVLVFGIIWFEPQKLFIEERVDEALPGAATAAGNMAGANSQMSEMATPADPAEPRIVAEGEFMSLEHESDGRALVVETTDGTRFLRFEDFSTSNGPDLVVYLSAKPASEDWYGYDEDFVDLGELKGNVGNQNYEIPDGVDLDRYQSAVVWCRRFTVGFAVASLR